MQIKKLSLIILKLMELKLLFEMHFYISISHK